MRENKSEFADRDKGVEQGKLAIAKPAALTATGENFCTVKSEKTFWRGTHRKLAAPHIVFAAGRTRADPE